MSTTRKTYGEKIVNEGMGGFLCPPNHPMHKFSVQTGRRDNPNGCYSLEAVAECSWLSPSIKGRASGILKRWQAEKLPLSDPLVQDWVRNVLGYFKGCYKVQTKQGEPSWNVSDLRILPDIDPILNADLHAGVRLIRQYYPEYQPSPDDFKAAYWGTKPQTA